VNVDYFDLPLIRPQRVHRRLYQEVIFASAINQNTLVVLPTGLGKTVIAVVLSAYCLEKDPQGKVVMLAPTRPLVGQHHQRFSEMLLIVPEKIQIVTGETPVPKRTEIWKSSSVVFVTPQTLRNDLEQGRYSLKDVALLIFDEAHRASGRYEYVGLADYYVRQRKNHRILALTASPGNVRELCDALYIENIEVRTEQSPDLIPYIQQVDARYVIVDLPPEYIQIEALLRQGVHLAVMPLIELGLAKPSEIKYLGRRTN
jgi:Fanconi anemia group M protein